MLRYFFNNLAIFILIVFSSCSILTGIHYNELNFKDSRHVLTLVQYHKLGKPENACVYLVFGKIKKNWKLPKNNYLKVSYGTEPIWIKWNDKGDIEMLYSYGDILENKIKRNKIKIINFRDEDDFIKLTKENEGEFFKFNISKYKYWF